MRHTVAATRWAYALAALVFVAGIALSLQTANWTWLSRSGSLVVVIGIVLTSSQIIENNRRLRRRRSQWERRGPVSSRDWAQHEEKLTHSRRHDEDLFENERSGLYMLIAGTLVWGFGDLAGAVFTP